MRSSELTLRYIVFGEIGDVRLPPPATCERADDLWRHTCFEAFVRGGHADAYYEFNLAPSSQWAAYRFSSYRADMTDTGNEPWSMQSVSSPERFEFGVELDLRRPDLSPTEPWRLGLSAVIEDKSGDKTYWALAHPPGKPDFHHPDAFAIDLSPTEPA